jgi:hypothetical protein
MLRDSHDASHVFVQQPSQSHAGLNPDAFSMMQWQQALQHHL